MAAGTPGAIESVSPSCIGSAGHGQARMIPRFLHPGHRHGHGASATASAPADSRPVRWQRPPTLHGTAPMERHEFGERDVDVDDVVNVALDEPAEITLPSFRSRSPCPAIRVVAVVRDGDDRVELKAGRLDEMVVGRGIGVPGRTQHDVHPPKEIGNATRLDELAADEHGQRAPRRLHDCTAHGARWRRRERNGWFQLRELDFLLSRR